MPVYTRTQDESVMEDAWRKMGGANIVRNLVQTRCDAVSRMKKSLKKFQISESMQNVHKELSNLLSKTLRALSRSVCRESSSGKVSMLFTIDKTCVNESNYN